ncbi:MAG: zonular occludens toxin domain-containing protein [Brachymonas sp.]|nr:zonular occludens toxin domain-containing protein [Brachymonas sp.]
MIILITGTPGSGKTLYTVSELLNKQFKDRPLYINGIPDLLIPHEPLSDEDLQHWFDGRVQTNGVICIDEVQRLWRPRSSTSAVPDHIAKLETHRHQGLDFVIITQHPQLIDANVRRLVGRHIHVRRAWGMKGAMIYEWDHCSTNTQAVKQAQGKLWRYNKKAYELYKSSELHTKAHGRVPMILKIGLLLMVLAPLIWYKAGTTIYKRFGGEAKKMEQVMDDPSGTAAPGYGGYGQQARPMTPSEYVATFEPRVDGLQHTAPRYDELTKPTRVPLPVGCLKTAKRCDCFTQDATPYKPPPPNCANSSQKKASSLTSRPNKTNRPSQSRSSRQQ